MAEQAPKILAMPTRLTGWYTIYSGKFHATESTEQDIFIDDIAHQLARITRWHGAYNAVEFYSVAQHSIYVASLVFEELATRGVVDRATCKRIALAALLHDASEAYLLDMARDLKRMPQMEGYRTLEKHVQSLVELRFGVTDIMEMAEPVIKAADNAVLHAEAAQLFAPPLPWAETDYPKSLEIKHGWSPSIAKDCFLEMFKVYGGRRG